MDNGSEQPQGDALRGKQSKLSYKFQRLRERLRDAIRTGELSGKLPGERQLAKQFRVNAKTLSKALTDLAAEGLLDRSIGRGTYVRGVEAPAGAKDGKWLLIVDQPAQRSWAIDSLQKLNPDVLQVSSKQVLRPSDLAGVTGVIDVANDTPEETIRDLLVRNIPTVVVMRQPGAYSSHSVSVDRQLGAANLARELALLGHRRFFVVEGRGLTSTVHDVVRQIVMRYDTGASVDHGYCTDVPAAVRQGATAIICACTFETTELMDVLEANKIRIPQQVSVGSTGATGSVKRCTGYYVNLDQLTEAIAKVLREHGSARPVNLWLAGAFYDGQTLASPPGAAGLPAQGGVSTSFDSGRPA